MVVAFFFFFALIMVTNFTSFGSGEAFQKSNRLFLQQIRSGYTSVFTDVHDGSRYKRMIQDGVAGKENQYTVNVAMDGLGRGTPHKWVITITINELDVRDRFKDKFVLVHTVYIHEKQSPSIRTLLGPLIEQLKALGKRFNCIC
jgi:hypothetical protein